MLRSDTHHDAIRCNRDLEYKQLMKAKRLNAMILDGGDLFDAMQGKKDRRGNKGEIRPEYVSNNYFDTIVDLTAEEYAPYAKLFVLLAQGNHETSVQRHNEINLSSNLAYKLRSEYKSKVVNGGFGGWVRFHFEIQSTVRRSIDLKYLHNGGSNNAPVTKGIIDTNRQGTWIGKADVVWNGHNHKNYLLATKSESLSASGRQQLDTTWFIRTPGYNNDWGDGTQGWNVEGGRGPEPLGCAWLRFYIVDHSAVAMDVSLDLE